MSATGLLLTLLPSLSGVILGLALSSTGVFICQSATMSFIADSVSVGRSLATGLYNTSYYAGGAIGAGVAGLAYEGWGWGWLGALDQPDPDPGGRHRPVRLADAGRGVSLMIGQQLGTLSGPVSRFNCCHDDSGQVAGFLAGRHQAR